MAAGRPNGARSVGKAIKGLDHKTSQVPWHRVVGQDGKLQDAPSGALQLQRLQDEGARPKQGEAGQEWVGVVAGPVEVLLLSPGGKAQLLRTAHRNWS